MTHTGTIIAYPRRRPRMGITNGSTSPKLMTVTTNRKKRSATIMRANHSGPVRYATKFRIGYLKKTGKFCPRRARSIQKKHFSRLTANSGRSVPSTKCISGFTRSLAIRSCAFSVGNLTMTHVAAASPQPNRDCIAVIVTGDVTSMMGVMIVKNVKISKIFHDETTHDTRLDHNDGGNWRAFVSRASGLSESLQDELLPLCEFGDNASVSSPHMLSDISKGRLRRSLA
mmetsp:Transcript_6999/g.13901  ORF Transcript_6999/g.13901 Transcript_6999/m.13901 type:complete len:228 (+) Transcript_6999:636-1319(+)